MKKLLSVASLFVLLVAVRQLALGFGYIVKVYDLAVASSGDLMDIESEFGFVNTRANKYSIVAEYDNLTRTIGTDRVVMITEPAIGGYDHLGGVSVNQDDSTADCFSLTIEEDGKYKKRNGYCPTIRIHIFDNLISFSLGSELFWSPTGVDIDVSQDRVIWSHLYGDSCFFSLQLGAKP